MLHGVKKPEDYHLVNIRHESLRTYMEIVHVYVSDWPTGVQGL